MYFTILFLRNTQKIICPGEIAENGSSESDKNLCQRWKEIQTEKGEKDEKAEQCYYELTFTGNAVEIYAIKAPAHGKEMETLQFPQIM